LIVTVVISVDANYLMAVPLIEIDKLEIIVVLCAFVLHSSGSKSITIFPVEVSASAIVKDKEYDVY